MSLHKPLGGTRNSRREVANNIHKPIFIYSTDLTTYRSLTYRPPTVHPRRPIQAYTRHLYPAPIPPLPGAQPRSALAPGTYTPATRRPAQVRTCTRHYTRYYTRHYTATRRPALRAGLGIQCDIIE